MLAECQVLDEKRHRLRQVSSGMRTGLWPEGALSVGRGILQFQQEAPAPFYTVLFKFTCVPPSAAVALLRVCAISRWRAKTLIFPEQELSAKIRKNRIPILPENSRSPTHLPDYSRFFQNFPGAKIRSCLARQSKSIALSRSPCFL